MQDKYLKIATFIDVDKAKQYLIFNNTSVLVAGTSPVLAKTLVSDINTQTNFVKRLHEVFSYLNDIILIC